MTHPDLDVTAAEFGARLKDARLAARMSRMEFARAVGAREKDVQRWETGRGWPHASRLPVIAAALQVSLDYLMGVRVPAVA